MNKTLAPNTYCHWDGLDTPSQEPRYDAILSSIRRFDSVLDIGAGDGTLGLKLRARKDLSAYIGVEPDPKAMAKANGKGLLMVNYHAEDYLSQWKEGGVGMGVVVFNESLYYMKDPVAVLELARNKALLRGGKIIVSIYLKPETRFQRFKRWLGFGERSNLDCAEIVTRYFARHAFSTTTRDVTSPCGTMTWRIWTAWTIPSPNRFGR